MSPPAMTKHVDRLERDGLVARTTSDDDRRCVGVTLTDEGQKVLRRVRSRRTAWLDRPPRASSTRRSSPRSRPRSEPLRKLLPEEERP